MAAISSSEARVTERLYERHHRRVFAFCLQQLRDRDDASDALQTTYLHAHGAVRRGVVPSLEAPWLIAIARNVCRTRWDAGTRRRRLETVHDPQQLAELAPSAEPADALAGVAEALAALPEAQRRAVLLRDWQGLSYREVADELGVSLASAETLIHRGRKKLAHTLGEESRGFGLGSLLGWLKPGFVGSSVVAKVAIGTAVAIGVTVAAGGALVERAPSAPQAPRAHAVLSRHAPAIAAPAARRAPVSVVHSAHALVTAHSARAPESSPAAGPAAAAPPAAEPTTVSAPTPTDAAGTTVPVAAATPVATTAAQVTAPATAPADPVVTTATDTAQPVVTTVVTTAEPVVTQVTAAVQPVVTTVAAVVPAPAVVVPAPPPVHVP
jgi:RNA polymerase sigma factor (sigma-70 family)